MIAPRLEVTVRPCRWGWESNVRFYLVAGLSTELETGWWRPTKRAAVAVARRYARKTLAHAARHRRTETLPVDES